ANRSSSEKKAASFPMHPLKGERRPLWKSARRRTGRNKLTEGKYMQLKSALRILLGGLLFLAVFGTMVAGVPKSKRQLRTSPSKPAPFKRTKFKPACANPTYPTPAPAKSPEILSQCGLAGSGTGQE